MLSRKVLIGTLAVGASALAVVAATPASAAVPTKVYVTAGYSGSGTPTSGTSVVVTGASTGALNFKDNRSMASLGCTSSSLKTAALTTGSGKSPSPIATIPSPNATFTGCTAAGGGASVAQNGTWALRADQTSNPLPANATTPPVSGQTTQGTLANVSATVTSGGCTFTIVGSVAGTFKNGNPSTITVANSNGNSSTNLSIGTTNPTGTGCLLGKVQAGDTLSLTANTTYNVTATSGGSALNPFWIAAS